MTKSLLGVNMHTIWSLGAITVALFQLTASRVAANDCCEYVKNGVNKCMSGPAGNGPTSDGCNALGGSFFNNRYCDRATKDCLAKIPDFSVNLGRCEADTLAESEWGTCWADMGLPPPPIPTVSEWGVAIMTLLILSAATVVLIHRRTGNSVT